MAHLILVHTLDLAHDNAKTYVPTLINLDMVVTIEPSRVHSIIYTKNNNIGIRVKESLEDLLKLANSSKKVY
jgi:hypothetical protein